MYVSIISAVNCAHSKKKNCSTPETFDIVTNTVDVASRKNLAQISRILTQITSGSEFGDDNPIYVPINDYVRKAIHQITAWFLEGIICPLILLQMPGNDGDL